MNNQAAQTMPELPPSFARVHNDGYWTLRVRGTAEFIVHDSRQTPAQEVYSSDQMRDMYQQGYAAALAQTAGVADGWKLVPVEPTEVMCEAAMSSLGWTRSEAAAKTAPITPASPMMEGSMKVWSAMLAAAPAASGSHPDALPDGTLSKSTVKRVDALRMAQGDRDAYEGAREDLLDWKGRAQRAEAELRLIGYTGIVPTQPPHQDRGEVTEALRAAYNCICELRPTQARSEVLQMILAAIGGDADD